METKTQADLPGDLKSTTLQHSSTYIATGLAALLGLLALYGISTSPQQGVAPLTWIYASCAVMLGVLAVLTNSTVRARHGNDLAGAILVVWAVSAIAALNLSGSAGHSGQLAIIILLAAVFLESSVWFVGVLIGLLGAWTASWVAGGQLGDPAWTHYAVLLAVTSALASLVFNQQNQQRNLTQACLSLDHRRRETLARNLDKLDAEMIRSANIEKRLARANQKLRVLARVDTLTGIANKRQLHDYIDREWRRHCRDQQPLSMVLCDVDYFKAYNDHFGAQHGDDTLQRVAKLIEDSLHRPADLAARHAGSVFAALLPNTEISQARHVAATIQKKVAGQALAHPRSPLGKILTLSLGVTSVIPTERMQATILMATAERALADAKEQGRNRAIVEPVPEGGV